MFQGMVRETGGPGTSPDELKPWWQALGGCDTRWVVFQRSAACIVLLAMSCACGQGLFGLRWL